MVIQRFNPFGAQVTTGKRGCCLWLTSRRGNAYFAAVERHGFTLLPRLIHDEKAPLHLCWLGVALSVGRLMAKDY